IASQNGRLLATVLLNVQGRDVGSFVEEARARVAKEVSLPAGYYVGGSGRWENQEHARQRLQIVVPLVLLVIFVLLYFTYHSLAEAAHVLLAVPFALTGGVYLLWLLGYNFSVAVWVGFIALFGTAVQTGVVMVIYLEEAVARKRESMGGRLTRAALREAVIDGALLRLRGTVVTQVRSGDLTVVLLSPTGALHQGRNSFTIEFRSANGSLVDVGTVRASGNMPMPGMAMSSGLKVQPTSVPGRYQATAEFGM